MFDLIFKGLYRVIEKGKILLFINDLEFIVLIQQKRNDYEYVNYIFFYFNIDV